MASVIQADGGYDDLVLSSVHLGKSERSVLTSELTSTIFTFESKEIMTMPASDQTALDEDGDFDFQRAHYMQKELLIFHQMGTPLADVGMQVWLGSLLLGDWILYNPSVFFDSICLELGAGTGLCSILAGMFCKHLFCTDTGESVLKLCQQNIEHNQLLLKSGLSSIKVRDLNWISTGFKITERDKDLDGFGWSNEEIYCLRNAQIFLAADVIYDNTLTEAFFNKVVTLMESNTTQEILLLISLEKRFNFTIEDLNVTSHAYNHFQKMISNLGTNVYDKKCRSYKVEQLDTSFPQYFEYERPKELELWQIIGTKLE